MKKRREWTKRNQISDVCIKILDHRRRKKNWWLFQIYALVLLRERVGFEMMTM